MITYKDLFITSRCIPNGVVRENAAPNAMVSTYVFRLAHCHQPLHTCPAVGSRAYALLKIYFLGLFKIF